MKKINYILFITLGITFFACDDDSNQTTTDRQAPVIQIISPQDGDTFHNNHSLKITALITENDELHTYGFELRNTTLDSIIASDSKHNHGKEIELDTTVVINVSDHSNFELTVSADDHNNNSATETIDFHIHPM